MTFRLFFPHLDLVSHGPDQSSLAFPLFQLQFLVWFFESLLNELIWVFVSLARYLWALYLPSRVRPWGCLAHLVAPANLSFWWLWCQNRRPWCAGRMSTRHFAARDHPALFQQIVCWLWACFDRFDWVRGWRMFPGCLKCSFLKEVCFSHLTKLNREFPFQYWTFECVNILSKLS